MQESLTANEILKENMSNFSVKNVSSDASAPLLGENIGTVPENLLTENWYPSGGWGLLELVR